MTTKRTEGSVFRGASPEPPKDLTQKLKEEWQAGEKEQG